MPVTISITDADIFTAIRSFILACVPSGLEVVRGQNNGVPMPAGNFCVMTPKSNARLETNVTSYTDPITSLGTSNQMTPSEFAMQLDFYGSNSAQNCKVVEGLSLSAFGLDQFTNAGIKPLFASDPMQLPLINGEEQYEQRWKTDFHLQYNPVIQTSQDFAGTLSVTPVNVERAYPA